MKVDVIENNSILKLEIQLNETSSFSCTVSPPDGAVSFVDILPEVYLISDKFLESQLENLNKAGIVPKCAKGCCTCCRQLITVSVHEAILLEHIVNMLDAAEKNRIKLAFDRILEEIEEKNFLKDLLDFHINNFQDKASVTSIQKKYWDLQLSCPFLNENSCSIYAYRPLVCRQYLVASDPVHCHGSFKDDHLVKKIQLTNDFASAAASFDGVEAIQTRGIPLPIIFLINGILSYFPRPKTSFKEMIMLFLKHVDQYFGNKASS